MIKTVKYIYESTIAKSQMPQFKNSQIHKPQIVIFAKMKKYVPIEEGDYYLTPEGYRCFTEQYHLKRGYCCKSGCRHCPYGFTKEDLKQS